MNTCKKNTPDKFRKLRIQLIQIGRKELKWSDDQYLGTIARFGHEFGIISDPPVFPATSSTQLSDLALKNMLTQMTGLGFVIKKKAKKEAPPPPVCTDPTYLKMVGLWAELVSLGAVKNKAEAALMTWIKNQTGIDHPQWLSNEQSVKLIEQLKKWRDRVQRASEKTRGSSDHA